MPSNWWDIAEHGEQAANERKPAGDLQPLPEGKHRVTVKRVINAEDRIELHLAPEDRGSGWVFPKLYRDNSHAARLFLSLAAALEMTPQALQSEIESGDLVGRQVTVRVYHVSKDGRLYVNAGSFHPLEKSAAEPARPRAVNKPAPGADAIPF